MSAAKALVAVLGAAVTAALGIFPANTGTWQALTIVSAALTAAAVYLVPNAPKGPNGDRLAVDHVDDGDQDHHRRR
jgi:hypothetical protein